MRMSSQKLSPEDFAARVGSIKSETDRKDLIALLRSDSEYATSVLMELASSRDSDLRLWAAEVAEGVLGQGAVPVLRKLVRDRDSDVRIDALVNLARADPSEVAGLIPTLRSQVASENPYDAQAALWALGIIGDPATLDIVRAAQTHSRLRVRGTAVAVELMLADPEQLYRRIENHDHEYMPWLARAAALLGTPEAREALGFCAANAPDEDCRNLARAKLTAYKPVR